MIALIDDDPGITANGKVDQLTTNFNGLKISKAVHSYITKKCNLSLKQVSYHSIYRNSEASIEKSRCWVFQWEPHLNYLQNTVFVDKSSFTRSYESLGSMVHQR